MLQKLPNPTTNPTTNRAEGLTIDCDECVMRRTSACRDCVVTFLCDLDDERAVVIDADEARALHLLSSAGLVPALRHHRAG
jgi:hypothetical protein